MTTLAAIVIAGGKRTALIEDEILPSLKWFDEVLVVGEHHDGDGHRYLHVPDLTKTTNDALVKRDVGALATTAELLCYFSDDHRALGPFAQTLRQLVAEAIIPFDVLIPSRWAQHPEEGLIRIPNGETERYCAGHAGVFRRRVVQWRPWTAHQHHRNWDLLISHEQLRAGFALVSYPQLQVKDLEPENRPWL